MPNLLTCKNLCFEDGCSKTLKVFGCDPIPEAHRKKFRSGSLTLDNRTYMLEIYVNIAVFYERKEKKEVLIMDGKMVCGLSGMMMVKKGLNAGIMGIL